jgi:hypothetical protein
MFFKVIWPSFKNRLINQIFRFPLLCKMSLLACNLYLCLQPFYKIFELHSLFFNVSNWTELFLSYSVSFLQMRCRFSALKRLYVESFECFFALSYIFLASFFFSINKRHSSSNHGFLCTFLTWPIVWTAAELSLFFSCVHCSIIDEMMVIRDSLSLEENALEKASATSDDRKASSFGCCLLRLWRWAQILTQMFEMTRMIQVNVCSSPRSYKTVFI